MDFAEVLRRRKAVRNYVDELDEGLAAGVFGVLEWGPIWKLLGIPDDVLPVAVVTVGTPAPESREQGSRSRGWKPLGEVVRWERW